MTVPPYAELQVASNYTFLEGASHPDELVRAAAALGLAALAVTDRNSLAGVVATHAAARQAGLRLVIGSRLVLTDGAELLCFPTDRAAYSRLSRLLTLGKRRAAKGECRLDAGDLLAHGEGQILVVLPPAEPGADFADALAGWAGQFSGRCYLAASRRFDAGDRQRLETLAHFAGRCGTPMVATNDVLYHSPARRPLQDVLRCIRAGCRLAEAGWRLEANGERHLKTPAEMARLFSAYPEAVARSMEIVERCRFDLDSLRYDYPLEADSPETAQERLIRLTWEGAARRYPEGVPETVRQTLEDELGLIGELGYAPYFLTVEDLVRFARGRGILCQGRGSAANSAVCFCLGITGVDPARFTLLFARFISAARNEPPDIDVDFEHERREEVIQYIYRKYGRDRAGLTATVIHYRMRSAIRDVGKVLGFSEDILHLLLRHRWGGGGDPPTGRDLAESGLDGQEGLVGSLLALSAELTGFPRHLSQHVGGFVITRDRLDSLVPIENAAMEGRTVIEWDKDDLDRLGFLKVDVLALGMLTAIRKCFDLLARHRGVRLDLASVPPEDPAVYDMLCAADSIGVFQVESRAQMSMLPRLKPRCFYDLVIEVAIVRPGPIQGDMVHPYLRRRQGKEKVDYPSDALEGVLKRTLGVPLFQEQAMQIAIVAGGFTPEEADQLRRAMATFRHTGKVAAFQEKLIAGMTERGYDPVFAEKVFHQIEGFGEYGFPESHAASFAHLVYVSAWLKCHHPAIFACALLNSQPMGFYAPAQIVGDARRHGVPVLPVDVNRSDWDCDLEPTGDGRLALRLGFRQVNGLSRRDGLALVASRGAGYASPLALWRRQPLDRGALEALVKADAFAGLGLARREALWAVRALGTPPPPLFEAAGLDMFSAGPAAVLPPMTPGEEVVEDYASLRLSLKGHPLALLRQGLARLGILPASRLVHHPGKRVSVAGLVLVRQRPGTAKVVFMTLEDETGVINVIVWPKIFERYRAALMGGRLLKVTGDVQQEDKVLHVIAAEIEDRSADLAGLTEEGAEIRPQTRDFH